MQHHTASDSYQDTPVYFQIVVLERQIFAWVGVAPPRLANLQLAMPTRLVSRQPPPVQRLRAGLLPPDIAAPHPCIRGCIPLDWYWDAGPLLHLKRYASCPPAQTCPSNPSRCAGPAALCHVPAGLCRRRACQHVAAAM